EELEKLPNIPAIAQANALQHTLTQILAQITQINTRMDQMETRMDRMETRMDRMEAKLNALSTQISTSEHNHMARVQNSLLARTTDRLEPLLNPSTKTAIEGYPTNPREITTMEDARLISVLEQLGLPTNGGRLAREKRLRQSIGLPPIAG
ncbi:uncharacterized protein A1O9_05464, partial [Exophiala aquamarina CBS 119918]